jgi:hypothetical protein
MPLSLEDLKQLEMLRSLKSTTALQKEQARANELRGEIEKIQAHRKNGHAADMGLMAMRTIRGDVLWQSWLDRTQSELNLELARSMAQIEFLSQRARKDIGRREAAAEISTQIKIAQAEETSKKAQTNQLELGVLWHSTAGGRKF